MRRSIFSCDFLVIAILSAVCALPLTASAQQYATDAWTSAKGITSDRLIVERPTLLSLGFEWMIKGDANGNAKAEVQYRKVGETQWHKALPMMRLHPDGPQNLNSDWSNHQGMNHYKTPNAFAGSILNLQPGTQYEARFTLTDPDGITGAAVKTAQVRTRAEPMPAAGGHVYNVYPYDYTGPEQQPAFIGLLRAYYTGVTNGDVNNAFPPRVQPGDIILVHAGLYKDNQRNLYGNNAYPRFYGVYFDGTYHLRASGTPEKPIVIKAAGDGEVIFDGDGVDTLFDVMGANYNYFEGITFRNAGTVFLTGRKELIGSSGLTIKNCKFYDISRGVWGDWAGSKDFYIADNIFIGRHDPNHLRGWSGALWKNLPDYPGHPFPPPINGPGGSELAVKVYGQGHVVAYNKVMNFHDGIDHATYGPPDGSPDHVIEENIASSNDFYGNDMYNFADNCFEADGGVRNMRIFRNRCFNSASMGLSYEPSYGGPFYAYQNLIYNNITGTLKGAWGALLYQNTIVGEIHPRGDNYPGNFHFFNNLFLALGAEKEVLSLMTDPYSESDYNGFRLNPDSKDNFLWVDVTKLPAIPKGAKDPSGFQTLEEYSRATGQDRHSIIIDYSDFVKASSPDRKDPTRLYRPEDYDFRLRPDSKAVDAGIVLPTINDDFTGKAPDLGAYEVGRPIPHYGPRTAADTQN